MSEADIFAQRLRHPQAWPDREAPFAVQAGRVRTRGAWLRDVAALRASVDTRVCPVYIEDGYRFAVALAAIWSRGGTPLLLPDLSGQTLDSLEELDCAPVMTGFPDSADEDHDPEPEAFSLDCKVIVQTSGTTGKPVRIAKTHDQIVLEVAAYAQRWADALEHTTIAATVSHQHIYGLLFKVLLAMASGRPFVAELLTTPAAVLRQGERVAWVASPAQLKRLRADDLDASLRASASIVFSSGGLLEPDAAARVERAFAAPAFEVYGSSETGGMATRQQFADRDRNVWRFLPGVVGRVDDEGRLSVCSPYTNGAWIETGDRVGFDEDGQFSLLGRIDRVVKIEEKRVSLTAIERALSEMDRFKDARALVLEGPRAQLAVVAELTTAGSAWLDDLGRVAAIRALRGELAERFDPFSVPRRFRFVDQLPVNAQGKIPHRDLAALFQPRARHVLPVVRDHVQQADGKLELSLAVPDDLDYFEGHFPSFPVVPGVAQLLWVRHFAALYLRHPGAVTKMTKVKFKSILTAETDFEMRLDYDAAEGRLAFSLADDGREFSSGIMWGGE